MIYMKTLIPMLMTVLCLEVGMAVHVETEIHPQVGDWNEAVNKEGLVRIPLQNPQGHAWFASLQMGTPLQMELACVFNNNHVLSAVYSKGCSSCPQSSWTYNRKKSSTFRFQSRKTMVVQDDGFMMSGYPAQDSMCIGMYGNTK